MALYTEKSYNDLADVFDRAERIRQNQLRQQQEQALQAYNAEKNKIDNKYEGGLGGFLGNIVGGIGKFFGDIGQGVGGMLGTGVASAKDLIESAVEGKFTDRNTRDFKRDWYKADSDADAAAKAAGTSLNAAANLASFIPGVGAGTAAGKAASSVAANTALGALGGFGDEFQQQGADASLESAANRAIASGAAGLATGGLNRKLGNATSKVGSALLNNKFATSTLGRGALSGALGGAVGGSTSAALGGGDVAQAALQGGLTGAAGGATQASIMAGANKLGQLALNKIKQPKTVTANNVLEDTQATETDGDGVTIGAPKDKITNRNKLQKIGDELQQNARETKWQGLYENLDKKTAERAVKTQAPQKLADMGVEPEMYGEYAKTSNYINEQVSKLAKDSKVKVNLPNLTDQLSADNTGAILSDPARKKYNAIVKQIVADGKNPSEYSASYLLEKSREIGSKAANLTGNVDDVKALRSALTDAKYILRDAATNALSEAGVTGDLTTEYIARGLKKMGANQDVIDYYSAPNGENAPNASDYINRSSIFEQARDMDIEMNAEKLTRNASKGKTNVIDRALTYTGLDKPVDTIGRNIIAPVAATAQNVTGKAVSYLGDKTQNLPQTQPLSQNTQAMLGNIIGRTTGQQQASNAVQNAHKAQDYQNLENMLSNIQSSSQGISGGQTGNMLGGYSPATPAQSNSLLNQLTDIANGMSLAMAAGDISAYSQLADLYKTAYNIYQMQNELTGANSTSSSNQKLSKTQQQANAASISLDQLENMDPDFGYAVSGIPILGNIVNAQGNQYESTAKSLAMQIGYMLSGANIKESEAEAIGRAYVPQPFDSDETRRYKLNQARKIIQQYQNGYVTDDQTA